MPSPYPVQPLLRASAGKVLEIIEHLKPLLHTMPESFKDHCCPAPFAEKEELGGVVWGDCGQDSMSQGSPGTLTRPCHPATLPSPRA